MIGRREAKIDYLLLGYFALFLVFGLVMLSSASSPIGKASFGDDYFFIKRQLLLGVLPGIALFLFFAKIDYHILKKWSGLLYLVMIVLLILVFIPGIGLTLNESKSWIVLFGYSFQPAELAKLFFVIFFSAYLSSKARMLSQFQTGFLVAIIVGSLPILFIVFQPDLGSACVLFALMFGMLFLANTRISHLGLLGATALLGLVLLILIAPYRVERLTTFLEDEKSQEFLAGRGYQIYQAEVAIGSGGLAGKGWGKSVQKFQYLPEVHADSIFAIIAEEMGFFLSSLVIILLLLICYRGFKIAKHAPDEYGRLLVSGIIIWFMAQSFLNIGSIIGILPLTGVPLPFVSHGGSALFVSMGAVGILMNVSKQMK